MVATYISALEEKGYIYKDVFKNDKRSFYIMPTEKAKLLVAAAKEKNYEYMNLIENNLGEEKFSLLIELLNEVQKVNIKKRYTSE